MASFGREKVRALEALGPILADLRARGKRIVFTNGCFDLVHPGHVMLLRGARALGDVLVVGLNSDASIRRIKGPGRPIYSQDQRAIMISAVECVDHVVFFDEATPMRLLEAIRPDILAKGEEYAVEEIVGHEFVASYGGRVARVPILEGLSTSALLEKIWSLRYHGYPGADPGGA